MVADTAAVVTVAVATVAVTVVVAMAAPGPTTAQEGAFGVSLG